jgi:hypothetical protein
VSEGCTFPGQSCSAEEEKGGSRSRKVNVKGRPKQKESEAAEAEWENRWKDAWLRELLSSSSEEEEEGPERKKPDQGKRSIEGSRNPAGV